MYSHRHFIRALHALPGRPFPTAAHLRVLDVGGVVAACTASALPLSSAALEKLLSKNINGAKLLRMTLPRLEGLGLELDEAGELMDAVDYARHGGPVTVQLIFGVGKEPMFFTFHNPQHLEKFLVRQGAAGLSKKDLKISSDSFRDLEQGEVYTVNFNEGGDLRADVALAKFSCDTGAKVVIENVKRAVVEASLSVFGEALSADVRNDIQLKFEEDLLGDVDCLFKGPTVHVLLERKRRLGDTGGDAALAISQVKTTRLAYSKVGLDVVDGRKCRVKSMVYAEAMGAQAQQELLKAGIYVLSGETMAILSP